MLTSPENANQYGECEEGMQTVDLMHGYLRVDPCSQVGSKTLAVALVPVFSCCIIEENPVSPVLEMRSRQKSRDQDAKVLYRAQNQLVSGKSMRVKLTTCGSRSRCAFCELLTFKDFVRILHPCARTSTTQP